MNARGFSIALVALTSMGAALWFAFGSHRAPRGERALAPGDVPSSVGTIPENVESVEENAARPESVREAIEAPPEIPGPGQAMLLVEVVALETSEPLAGVELWLWTETDQGDKVAEPEHVVVTGEGGRAELVVVAGRAFDLGASATRGRANGEGLDLAIEPLAQGEERLVRVTLPTAWTLAWDVRVVDGETAQPISGAEVEVLAWDDGQSIDSMPILARGTTDGDGRAAIRLPKWESMAARIQASGYFWGGCSIDTRARSFESAAHVMLHRPAALTPLVLDASGKPAAGIDVWLHAFASELIQNGYTAKDSDWWSTTDANGTCEFLELPARVELRVELRRGARVPWRPKTPQGKGLTLEPGEYRRVEWRFEPGCTLSGTFQDQAGDSLPQVPLVLVELLPWSQDAAHQLEGSFRMCGGIQKSLKLLTRTTTDDAGRFSITDLPSGIFELGPDMPERIGLRGGGPKVPEVLADLPAVVRTICIAPEERTKTVELVLDRGLYIRGQVFGPDGDPPGRTTVDGQGVAALSELLVWDSLDNEGRFELGPLVDGRYVLSAQPPDPFFAAPEPVEVPAGEEDVVLEFSWGGNLSGRVVDEQSGKMLNASIFLNGLRQKLHSHTGSDGFLFQCLPPGNYDLAARVDDGRVGVLRGIVLGAGSTQEELVVPVALGAKILTRTVAPLRSSPERLGIEWEGVLVWSWWGGEPRMNVLVPPGEIRVSWWALEDGVERLVHEERRRVGAGEEASVEYVAPE